MTSLSLFSLSYSHDHTITTVSPLTLLKMLGSSTSNSVMYNITPCFFHQYWWRISHSLLCFCHYSNLKCLNYFMQMKFGNLQITIKISTCKLIWETWNHCMAQLCGGIQKRMNMLPVTWSYTVTMDSVTHMLLMQMIHQR